MGNMAYPSLPPRVNESKAEIRRTRSPRRTQVGRRAEGFGQLAVSPAAFSQQLADMQLAMQRAVRSAKTR